MRLPEVQRTHPAKFSGEVLSRSMAILHGWMEAGVISQGDRLIDPFAGVGRVHMMADLGLETVGIEIEPEWAMAHERNLCGDATRLPFDDDSFQVAMTSPTYGSRMADHQDAKERCKPCGGTGQVVVVAEVSGVCSKCAGKGVRSYERNTYRHKLNRIDPATGRAGPLHERNSGRMQWGRKYRDLHEAAWAELARVMTPGGRFLLNISDHVRREQQQPVTAWHITALESVGFAHVVSHRVKTRRYGYGQNRDSRAPNEWLIEFIR